MNKILLLGIIFLLLITSVSGSDDSYDWGTFSNSAEQVNWYGAIIKMNVYNVTALKTTIATDDDATGVALYSTGGVLLETGTYGSNIGMINYTFVKDTEYIVTVTKVGSSTMKYLPVGTWGINSTNDFFTLLNRTSTDDSGTTFDISTYSPSSIEKYEIFISYENLTVNANDFYNDSRINNFNIEIDGDDNYSTTNGVIFTDLPLNITNPVNYNITIWNVSNYLNRTYEWYNNESLQSIIYPYTMIKSKDGLNSTYIDNFDITYNSIVYNSVNKIVYLPLYNSTDEIILNNASNNGVDYTDETINLTSNPHLENYTFTLFPNPSILNINIYKLSDGDLVTENITVQIIGDVYTTSLSTVTGNAYFNNLTQGQYIIRLFSTNFSTAEYQQNIGLNTYHNLSGYLFNNDTSTVTFSTKTQNTAEPIEDATYSISTIVDDEYKIISYLSSDLVGQVTFNYETDKIYKFVVSKSGYTTKSFQLGPSLDYSYTVWMVQETEYNISESYTGININYLINPYLSSNNITLLSSRFYDNQTNNFTFIINAVDGDLINYGYDITFKTTTVSNSGANSQGEELNSNIIINNSILSDIITLKYYYTSSLSGYHEFYEQFTISGSTSYGLISNLKNNTYGLGILERLLILIIIGAIFGGLITLFNGPLAGALSIAFIFGYFLFSGFIEIWFLALPITLLFFYIISRSD